MSLSALLAFARDILTHVPGFHWALMAVISIFLIGILLIRKRCSVYAAISFGIVVFIGLLLLDTAVFIRYFGFLRHRSGHNLGLAFNRLFYGSNMAKSEVISNWAVFVPLGFFLAEFWDETKRVGVWHRIGCAALVAFGLSLSIECLQLILHVGFFELTDLVMNTVGAFVGASLAALGRKVWGRVTH